MSLVRDTGGHGLPRSGKATCLFKSPLNLLQIKTKRIEGARRLDGAVKEEAVGL